MLKTLGILGAGHLGMQIAHHAISDHHFDKVVFFDDWAEGSDINGFELLGGSNEVVNCFNKGLFTELLLGIGYNHMKVRASLYNKFYAEGVPFGKIVHSSCWVDPTATIGDGTVVYPGATIDAGVTCGSNVLINIACAIAHDTIIGNHSFISPQVAIAGFCSIGEGCMIGVGSTIIDNIQIGDGVRTGGGTVVIKDIKQAGLLVGNPAREIKKEGNDTI